MKSDYLEKVDEIDLGIIQLLQEDSRLSFQKIANKLGIASGTAFNRVKNLEEKKILTDYTVMVDPIRLGYSLTALIMLQAEGTHLIELEKEISEMSNVVSVYDITGDYDIAVVARFKNRLGLNAFIKKLLSTPYVKRTVTNVVLSVVKEDFRVKIE